VRPGRFGAYVNWGKVNATIPKLTSPNDIALGEAIDLIEEREGRPSGVRAKPGAKAKAPAKKAAAKKKPAIKRAAPKAAPKKAAAK
jgi:DNA topoisomerase I